MATDIDVLQVITSTTRRGAERFALELEASLVERGWRVRTVALTAGTEPILEGVEVLGPTRLGPRTLLALRRAAADASVVVAHGSTTLPASYLATLGLRTPFVYRNIGDPRYWSTTLARRLRSRLFLSRAATVVALTERTAGRLAELYHVPPARTVPIPRAVSATAFPRRSESDRIRARADLDIEPSQRIAICIGALSPEKDVTNAVRALHDLPDNWLLLVVGDGPDRDVVDEAVAALPAGRVRMLGQVSDPAPLLAAADVLVLPSLTEGLPGVVIEAALVGVPAVSTDVGFVDEIIDDGVTGRIVPTADPAALAAAVLEIEPRLDAMGAAANERVSGRFSLDAAADKWEAVLDDLVTRPGGGQTTGGRGR